MSEKTEGPPSKTSLFKFSNIKSAWSTYIAIDYFDEDNALVDHLANERTWHNWLALSNATAWMGIVVAQMAKISTVVNPAHYHMLNYKACICQALSVLILLIGTYRFFCEQSAVIGNGTRASSWTLLATGGLVLMLTLSFFIMLVVANTDVIGKQGQEATIP